MLDTQTTFNELAHLMHKSPNDFYSRVSVAKYYENTKNMHRNSGLPWNWMCKIGLKDESFVVKLTSYGVLGISPLVAQSNLHKQKIYRILSSYADYLDEHMGRLVKQLNAHHGNPAN